MPIVDGGVAVRTVAKLRKAWDISEGLAAISAGPLLKKEPGNQPSNLRAVALLRHACKVTEKVIDKRGLRSGETAILWVLQAIAGRCRYICVLDLGQGYASVPRGDLVGRVMGLLRHDLGAMVETMLVDTLVTTIGDEGDILRTMERGVPEGLPLSPCLFNVFIDALAVEVLLAVGGRWRNPLNLVADDIVVMAPTARICSNFGCLWRVGYGKRADVGYQQVESACGRRGRTAAAFLGRATSGVRAGCRIPRNSARGRRGGGYSDSGAHSQSRMPHKAATSDGDE